MSAPASRPPPRRPFFLEPWFQDMMKPVMPPILVSDFEDDPPITVRYIQGDNDLDFKTVYTSIMTLSHHAGRGLLRTKNESDPDPVFYIKKKCDPEFLEAFWKCASYLCDYFADFLAFDTAHMQSVWFHLLDKLQEATILPHYYWISDMPFCEHAEEFVRHSDELYRVISYLIAGLKRIAPPSNMLGTDHMNKNRRDAGVSGLKRWQQFLYKDSPGFLVPKSKRLCPIAAGVPTDDIAFEAHIPRGGLALIDSHTKRLRKLTSDVYRGDSGTRTEAVALAEFDQKAPKLDMVSTYTAIDGREVSLHPMYPDPECPRAPCHHPGLVDPDFQSPRPGLERLNELAGTYKGKEKYQHPNDDDGGKFPMLSFATSEALQDQTLQSRFDRAAYSDMQAP